MHVQAHSYDVLTQKNFPSLGSGYRHFLFLRKLTFFTKKEIAWYLYEKISSNKGSLGF